MPYRDKRRQADYQREWMAARRAEFFAGKACAQCASTRDLELDHIDPAQKVSHRVWSWGAERRAAELAKCQVLCHRCHFWKTASELPYLSLYANIALRVTNSVTCPSQSAP